MLTSKEPNNATPKGKGKGKATATAPSSRTSTGEVLPQISQRSLFLALYAKYLSGEKSKDEEAEMVMGPQDIGACINKQLLTVSRVLEAWFEQRRPEEGDEIEGSQGWLEYLYGMVLAKEKNEELAMYWLVRSVHLCPMNWGCWLEMTGLISRVEDVRCYLKLFLASSLLTQRSSTESCLVYRRILSPSCSTFIRRLNYTNMMLTLLILLINSLASSPRHHSSLHAMLYSPTTQRTLSRPNSTLAASSHCIRVGLTPSTITPTYSMS